jgi:hypothetical protein
VHNKPGAIVKISHCLRPRLCCRVHGTGSAAEAGVDPPSLEESSAPKPETLKARFRGCPASSCLSPRQSRQRPQRYVGSGEHSISNCLSFVRPDASVMASSTSSRPALRAAPAALRPGSDTTSPGCQPHPRGRRRNRQAAQGSFLSALVSRGRPAQYRYRMRGSATAGTPSGAGWPSLPPIPAAGSTARSSLRNDRRHRCRASPRTSSRLPPLPPCWSSGSPTCTRTSSSTKCATAARN